MQKPRKVVYKKDWYKLGIKNHPQNITGSKNPFNHGGGIWYFLSRLSIVATVIKLW